jgi:predicted molibdopterin-dependent oxidoreductase YjgC
MDADAAFVRADLFKNYSVSNATGVTQTGISSVQLDVSASGTAGTFVVQAIDISQDPENSDTSSANANILVRINNHFYRSGTGL